MFSLHSNSIFGPKVPKEVLKPWHKLESQVVTVGPRINYQFQFLTLQEACYGTDM